MRRWISVLLFIALLMGLTACSSWVKEDHLAISPYVEPAYPGAETQEESTPAVVSDRTELRGTVLSLIRDWTEQTVLYVRDYEGDIAVDLDETIRYATEEDPIGAYAVDYIDAEIYGDSVQGEISMSIVFRRSAAEIDAIVTVSGNSGAYDKIRQALTSFDVALTLRIRNYREADFEQFIYQYCLDNPSAVPVLPVLSAQIYPKEGSTRILELHFGYPVSREELRMAQSEVQTIMRSASSYVRSGQSETERAQLLCRFLSTRFSYTKQTALSQMPAYDLLCRGWAHSFSFASVFYAQCLAAELDCRMISGERNGAEHYWNLLCIDGVYYHVDLMRGLEEGETELRLLYAGEIRAEGYYWDETAYPPAAEEAENTEETVPNETETSTEPQTTEESIPEPTEESSESSTEAGNDEEPPAESESASDTGE